MPSQDQHKKFAQKLHFCLGSNDVGDAELSGRIDTFALRRGIDNVLLTADGNLLMDSAKKLMLHSGVRTLQTTLELQDLPTRVTTFTPLPSSFLAHFFANSYDAERIVYNRGPRFTKERIEEDIRQSIGNSKNRNRNRKILEKSTCELLEDGTIAAENVRSVKDTKKLYAELTREENLNDDLELDEVYEIAMRRGTYDKASREYRVQDAGREPYKISIDSCKGLLECKLKHYWIYSQEPSYGHRLLTRVTETDEHVDVDVAQLYDTFKFETIEAGREVDLTKREFFEHVLHLFKCKRVTKRLNPTTTTKVYRGIALKTLGPLAAKCDREFNEVVNFKPNHFHVILGDNKKVVMTCPTNYTSNGHQVKKIVTFQDNFKWTLKIGEKETDLKSLSVNDNYEIQEDMLKAIFVTVEKIKLCKAVYVDNSLNSVICTRLHQLETWKNTEEEMSSRHLRSIMCLKVVKTNSRVDVCKMCQKMTIKGKQKNRPINENQITMNRDLLAKRIPCASETMIELLLSQFENVGKHPKGRRWSKQIVNVCLQLYTRSPVGYATLRRSKMLVLPSTNLLVLYKGRIQHKVGFQDEVFRWMHSEASRMKITTEGMKGGVVIDEMSIQQDLQINKNGDVVELCGFTDVGEEGNTCNTLRMGEKKKVLGTHILQFIFLGLTGFRFPFAHVITTNVAAYDIHTLFWEATAALSMYGFTTLYTCMDGAQSNRTFQNINIGKNRQSMIAQSPECPCNSVIFMMDISHVLKKIRNNVLKSGVHKASTRNLTFPDGSPIQWQMWVDAFTWDCSNALKIHKKLTKEHIYPSSQSKMRNHLANEVLDSDMLNLMCRYQESLCNTSIAFNGAIVFLKQTSKLVEIFHDRKAVQSLDDPRLKQIADIDSWFTQWSEGIKSESISSTEKSAKLISVQCREDIHSCLVGFCELCHTVVGHDERGFIIPSLINSDIVENHFCQQRATYNGANSNPNVLQYQNNQNSIILGQNLVSNKSNAGTPSTKKLAQPYKFLDNGPKQNKRKQTVDVFGSQLKTIKVFRV